MTDVSDHVNIIQTSIVDEFKRMDKAEAFEILGLDRKATKEEIVERYNKLIKKNHPDLGGSEWITKRINKARDILLG